MKLEPNGRRAELADEPGGHWVQALRSRACPASSRSSKPGDEQRLPIPTAGRPVLIWPAKPQHHRAMTGDRGPSFLFRLRRQRLRRPRRTASPLGRGQRP